MEVYFRINGRSYVTHTFRRELVNLEGPLITCIMQRTYKINLLESSGLFLSAKSVFSVGTRFKASS